MTLYERSAATLELPAVLAMLQREAVSDMAKVRAGALFPSIETVSEADGLIAG